MSIDGTDRRRNGRTEGRVADRAWTLLCILCAQRQNRLTTAVIYQIPINERLGYHHLCENPRQANPSLSKKALPLFLVEIGRKTVQLWALHTYDARCSAELVHDVSCVLLAQRMYEGGSVAEWLAY